MITRRCLLAGAAAMIFAIFFDAGHTMAAEIKLMATGAMRSAFEELVPQFERATGHRVTTALGVIIPLKRRIDAGESFDIVILSPTLIDDLIKARKVAADTRAEFARTGLGIGVPKGAVKPDVTSVDALKRTFLNAKSLGYEAESQPGIQLLEVLERLGIAQEMRPKLKTLTNPPEALAKREVEMHVSSVAALLGNPAADFAGSFPREVQRYVDFTAGVSATTKEPDATKALLRFLMSPEAMPVFKSKGFERS